MTIWEDLVSTYKSTNLETIFASLGISGIPESDYSNLKIASLSQWILESAKGTSILATRHYNFGGLKWRDEMSDFATKVLYEAHDGPDYYCRFASIEAFITGYWKFLTRTPYTSWEDYTSSPEEYIEFIGETYAPNQGYVGKVQNQFAEARQLLALSDAPLLSQGTWIQETDEALYWMKGQYYIDQLDKVPDDDGFAVVITDLKEWFSSSQYPAPQSMKIAKGDVKEPSPIPVDHKSQKQHRKPSVKFDESPNHTKGRAGQTIDTIFLHNTDGSFRGTVSWFKNPASQVSAHYVISRQGEIIQMVKDEDTAWHAGRRSDNRRSIGIEHEATKIKRGLTKAMESASIALVKYLMQQHDIPISRVLPHRQDWGGSVSTNCPHLLWRTENDFDAWKEENLQEEEDSVTQSVTIIKPKNGDEFGINEAFTVEGTADEGVKTVNLYTSWGGTNFELKTSIPVVNGKWSIRIPDGLNTGGKREILAEGNDADGNSLDFYPDEVTIQIGTGMAKPTQGDRLSSPFGPRNGRMHNGVDIAANRGVPVFAVTEGVVSVVKTGCREGSNRCGGGYGNHVYIKHSTLELETRYAHLTEVTVSNGERVSRGQQIGTIGNTGNSTGPHLHFEIRKNGVAKNPLDFINPIV
ncbi:MAG: peptidoglycan DD-metalloendopeptidase family protein [Symploca sp. SIO2G7]|nr:peptidoglycan DD-metalloendopeptidase family protein [Symploca sp. SIO2G7]